MMILVVAGVSGVTVLNEILNDSSASTVSSPTMRTSMDTVAPLVYRSIGEYDSNRHRLVV